MPCTSTQPWQYSAGCWAPAGPARSQPKRRQSASSAPIAAGAPGGREGDAAGERRAEPGLRSPRGSASPGERPGELPWRPKPVPWGLAGVREEAGTARRAQPAGGRHGARGRVGEGPREAPAEAAAWADAAVLCPAHNSPGARGSPSPRPPPTPLLTGAIASGAGNSRAAQHLDSPPSLGPERSPKQENARCPRKGLWDRRPLSPRPCLSRESAWPGQVQTASRLLTALPPRRPLKRKREGETARVKRESASRVALPERARRCCVSCAPSGSCALLRLSRATSSPGTPPGLDSTLNLGDQALSTHIPTHTPHSPANSTEGQGLRVSVYPRELAREWGPEVCFFIHFIKHELGG